MHNTPVGIRVLKGAERRLFVDSLATIVDDLSLDNEPFDSGPFERLQRNQRISVLHTVARSLLIEEEIAPQLTATIEVAVGAVFERAGALLSLELTAELDGEDDAFPEAPSWRDLVRAACRETGIADDLSECSEDADDDWDLLLECLADRVLWDRDWEMEEQLDADPDMSRRVKQELDIDDDYYVTVPPEPTDEEAARLLGELPALTRESR